jgi:AmmeMemoRadiSam system protein A
MLNQDQRTLLLRIARESIAAVLGGQRPQRAAPDDELLQRPGGAFVTITEGGDLRGCIGSIEAVAPLWLAVSNSAISAAFRDPRFPPLSPDELDRIELEISVMSPIAEVESLDEIAVGRDGLIIEADGRAGLLLPQVATEYGWSRDEFLAHTCRKAGLPADRWKRPGCRIERFSAEVFSEANR